MKSFAAALCILFAALNMQAGPRQQNNASSQSAPQTAAAPEATTPDAAPPGGKISAAKAADIQQLMEVTGMKSMMSQVMKSMEDNLKPTIIASLPPGDYREQLSDLFFQKFNSKLDVQKFIDMAAISYDKYLSDEDIKGLIQFYHTPLGQKTLVVLPKLSAELQTQGMQMGQTVGQEAMTEVLAEHPELAKALQDAAASR